VDILDHENFFTQNNEHKNFEKLPVYGR